MKPEKILGYILFIGVIGILINVNWFTFVDPNSLLIVFGCTLGIVLISSGVAGTVRGPKSRLYRWQTVTIAFAGSGMIGIVVGLVFLLQDVNDPQSVGPAMAFAILSGWSAIIGMSLVSIPMEDRYNKETENYSEMSISRAAWFGFPIFSFFMTLFALFILIAILNNAIQ